MRSFYIIFFLFIFTSIAKAQTFSKSNFLGKDYQLYKGVLFKIEPTKDRRTNPNHTFFDSFEEATKSYSDNVLYPDSKYKFITVLDSLTNKVFLVKDIKEPSVLEKPILILEDTLTKKLIYFKYEPKYDFDFPFSTTKINIPAAYISENIDRNIDDMTNEIKISSPLSGSSGIAPLHIIKIIKKGVPTYYLSLTATGSTVVVDGKGVIILFTDGSKLTKPLQEVDADVGRNGNFNYSSFITLTQTDLTTLSSKKIKKIRLYIFDEEIPPFEAQKFQMFVSAIKKINK